MIPSFVEETINKDRIVLSKFDRKDCVIPKYDPEKHYLHLTCEGFFVPLLYLRHYIKIASDYYFSSVVGAKNIDLFMLTPSISSPVGPGSDSETIPITFGGLSTNLVDSSQFGFEPLLLNGISKVYCYLPSMRGENFDHRHLNQFYHCEAEIRGTLSELIPLIEGYIKCLAETLLAADETINLIAVDPAATKNYLQHIISSRSFEKITFSEAVKMLEENNLGDLVNYSKDGRDISAAGEVELLKIYHVQGPLWVNYYDRNRVPFYQKPNSTNPNEVINADLLFPELATNAFSGEVVGSGQRQDNPEEMYDSLKRQRLDPAPYEWYINLRRQKNYQTTSGFGLGIERFISWALGFSDIKHSIIYPRLKGVNTRP